MRKQTIEETGHSMVEETMGPILSIMSEALNRHLKLRIVPRACWHCHIFCARCPRAMGSAIEPFTLVNSDAHRRAHVPNKSAANKYEITLSNVV
jgi:hypothetical protein